MKLNKKGFTLIELLAVVVILLAISVMAITSISAAIERSKQKQDESRKAIIVSSAELYFNEHKNSMQNTNCITVSELVTAGAITEDEALDSNKKPFTGRGCRNRDGQFNYE